MTYIWNIYEPCDPGDIGEDPFDIFVYSLRKEEAPHVGDLIYIEGSNHRVVACRADHDLSYVQVQDDAVYYKVCVV